MKKIAILLSLSLVFAACSEHYTPKPRAYFRIDLPEKNYKMLDGKGYPYQCEIPVYSEVVPFVAEGEKYWYNLDFPTWNATINISYKQLNDTNLRECVADAITFVDKHHGKASRIGEKDLYHAERQLYGMLFDIGGTGVASTYQFYLTDSVRHFVRGALYFNHTPNNDSLAPVIEFLKADIDRMIETFEWKSQY